MKNDILGELLERNKALEDQFNKMNDSALQLMEINKEHQRINGELREENKKLKATLDKTKEEIEKIVYHYAFSKEDRRTLLDEVITIYEFLIEMDKEI